MALIDFILNLAGVLLWFSWRSLSFDPLATAVPTTLAGTLRRAEPRGERRWQYLAGLAALLFFRAWLYWQIGPSVSWVPSIKFGAIAIFLRSDIFVRACLFSVLSFSLVAGVSYIWLLLLSIVNTAEAQPDPVLRLVRLQLGPVEKFPAVLKIALPVVVAALFWLALTPLLNKWNIVPSPLSLRHRLEQAGTVGLASYLTWKYLLTALLSMYLLSSYVYLGRSAVWNFLTVTARNVLKPISILPLRIGKIDLTPVVGIGLVLLLAEAAERGLSSLYSRLPL